MSPLRLDNQSVCLNTTLQSETVTATNAILMEPRLKRLEANLNYLEAKLEIQNEARDRVEEKIEQIVDLMAELQKQYNELKETVEKFVQSKASSDVAVKDQLSFKSTLNTLDSKQNPKASSAFKQTPKQSLKVFSPQVQQKNPDLSLLELCQQMQDALPQQFQERMMMNEPHSKQILPLFSTSQKIQQQKHDTLLPEKVVKKFTKFEFDLSSDDSQEAIHSEQVVESTAEVNDLLSKEHNRISKNVGYTEKKRASNTKNNFFDLTKQGSNSNVYRSDLPEVSVNPSHHFASHLESPSYVSAEKPQSQANISRASQRVVSTVQKSGKQHHAKERGQKAQTVQGEWLLRNEFDKNGKVDIDEEARLPTKKLPSSFCHGTPLSEMTHFLVPKLSSSSATSAKNVFSNVSLYKWVENNVSKIAVGDLTLTKNNLPFIKLLFVSNQDYSQEFYLKPSEKPKVIEGRNNSVIWKDIPKEVMSRFVSDVYITKFATKGDADRFIKFFEYSKA